MFEGLTQLSLSNPYPNGVDSEDKAGVKKLKAYAKTITEIRKKLDRAQRVYLGIVSGERKGSIAYIQGTDTDYRQEEVEVRNSRDYYGFPREERYITRVYNDSIYCILGWDGRRNRVKWATYSGTVYLPNYTGPTIFEKFDKKAAAAKELEQQTVIDRDGNELAVGDRVVYINARYGCGASLDRGTVTEIKANVKFIHGDVKGSTIHVMIDNDDGQKSDIREPQLSVLKI